MQLILYLLQECQFAQNIIRKIITEVIREYKARCGLTGKSRVCSNRAVKCILPM